MSLSFATVLVEDSGPVRTVTVNRPQVRNAINEAVLRDLLVAFGALEAIDSVRAVVLTGAGDKAFAAGADIASMRDMQPNEAAALAALGHQLGDRLEGSRLPVIAAVDGYALGGGLELALLADFIYASDRAQLGFPEVGLGVIPGLGGTQRLPARVGVARARELIFSGAILPATEALRIGLVNAVVPAAELAARARAVAEAIATRAPLAVAEAKRVLRAGSGLPAREALEIEQQAFAGLFATADQKEGMRAFAEKRPAKFTGR